MCNATYKIFVYIHTTAEYTYLIFPDRPRFEFWKANGIGYVKIFQKLLLGSSLLSLHNPLARAVRALAGRYTV